MPEVARRVRPRAVCLGNLFRDQLDRYGELEHLAERWREMAQELPSDAVFVVNGDDPQVGDLARERPGSLVFGLDDPRHAVESSSTRPTRSGASAAGSRTSTPRRTSGTSASTAVRAARTGVPRWTSSLATSSFAGSTASVHARYSRRRAAHRAVRAWSLQRVQRARRRVARNSAGDAAEDVKAGLERFCAAFGRFERIAVGERRLLLLLVKNPAGANEAVRTLVAGGAPTLAVLALNDAIADGRDVSWIWDVDWEPLLDGLDRVIVTGERAAEMALRCKYGGFSGEGIEVVPSLEQALDRGLELDPGRRRPRPPSHLYGHARAPRIVAERGLVRPYWERAA